MSKIHHRQFSGKFDLPTRNAFRAKRRAIGVSMEQLGQFLKIHWSTVRKWEAGITTTCHPRHISRIAAFLDGIYDQEIRKMFDLPPDVRERSSFSTGRSLLPPQVKNRLRLELEKLIEEMLRDYLREYHNRNAE